MAKTYAIDGMIPVIHPDAFVHPDAILIGDAIVAAGCYIGPGATMRGDFGRVELKDGANLQDNCIMHSFPGAHCLVGINGHIGHGAILHGCTVEDDALIGMNVVVMDEAVIGAKAIVAASAFVPARMQVAPRTLVGGIPAKFMRDLSDKEIKWKHSATKEYQRLTKRCQDSFMPAEPLSEIEPDRPSYSSSDLQPLKKTREG